MTEKELQHSILRILYSNYKNNQSEQLDFLEIPNMIPELDRPSRVVDACRILNDKGYITAVFNDGLSGFVSGITVNGREYVEENILTEEELHSDGFEDTNRLMSEGTLIDESGNAVSAENGDELLIKIDNKKSATTSGRLSILYKPKNIENI